MSIILQFARDEIQTTIQQLKQIQKHLGSGNFTALASEKIFCGEVVRVLSNDATEVSEERTSEGEM